MKPSDLEALHRAATAGHSASTGGYVVSGAEIVLDNALRNAAPAILQLWRAAQEMGDEWLGHAGQVDALKALRAALAEMEKV